MKVKNADSNARDLFKRQFLKNTLFFHLFFLPFVQMAHEGK